MTDGIACKASRSLCSPRLINAPSLQSSTGFSLIFLKWPNLISPAFVLFLFAADSLLFLSFHLPSLFSTSANLSSSSYSFPFGCSIREVLRETLSPSPIDAILHAASLIGSASEAPNATKLCTLVTADWNCKAELRHRLRLHSASAATEAQLQVIEEATAAAASGHFQVPGQVNESGFQAIRLRVPDPEQPSSGPWLLRFVKRLSSLRKRKKKQDGRNEFLVTFHYLPGTTSAVSQLQLLLRQVAMLYLQENAIWNWRIQNRGEVERKTRERKEYGGQRQRRQ